MINVQQLAREHFFFISKGLNSIFDKIQIQKRVKTAKIINKIDNFELSENAPHLLKSRKIAKIGGKRLKITLNNFFGEIWVATLLLKS